jgi:translation initiation factor 2B subunit (eIF-2B alpha/beta/delta family)
VTSSREILGEIKADNVSGAADIYLKAIEFLRTVLRESSHRSLHTVINTLNESSGALLAAQPEMAPLYSLATAVQLTLADSLDSSDTLDRMTSLLAKLEKDQQVSMTRLVERATGCLPAGSTIVTVSFSSAVYELVANHPDCRTLKVVVPESRPMCEGVRLARALADRDIRTVLVTDFAVSGYLGVADAFVCGADAVTESYLVNKIGTALLSGIMKGSGKSSIALFTDTKLIKSDIFRFTPRFHPESEISCGMPPHCSIENRYFEQCPIENFTLLISDKDLYTVHSLRERVNGLSYPQGPLGKP